MLALRKNKATCIFQVYSPGAPLHMHAYLCSDSSPLQDIANCGVWFPVRHSGPLLVLYVYAAVCVCVCPSQTLICPPLFPFADYKLPEHLFLFCPFLGAALPTGNPPLHHLILRAGNLGTCPMRAVAWPSLGRLPWAPNPPAPGWGPRFPEWTQRDVLWPELGLQDPLGLTLPPRSRAPTLGSGISVPEDNPPPPPPAVAMLFGSTPRCTEASAPGKLCPKVTRRPSSWRGAFLSLAGSRETVI